MQSGAQVIGQMDASSTPIWKIPQLLAALQGVVDVAIGSR
jgi:hypothetical protein